MSENHKTPGFVQWLLKVFCREDYREEIQGDLQEIFDWRAEKSGLWIARLRYLFDALSAVRFYQPVKTDYSSSGAMLFSFLKSSFRNFKRHLGYTSLNILGLALGLSAALFILQYVSEELSYNNSSGADQLYRVSNDYNRFGNMIYESSMTFSGVGPAMEQDLPEVIESVRLFGPGIGVERDVVVTRPDKPQIKFKEQKLFFAEPGYVNFFDLMITHGVNNLDKPNTAMLTPELAKEYFGSVEDALGKRLKYNDVSVNLDLLITGVFERPGFKLQIDADILVSYITMERENPDFFVNDWGGNSFVTFVKVTEQAAPRAIEQAMSELTLRYKPGYAERNEQGEYDRVNRYFLTKVTDIHLNSKFQNEVGPIGDANTIRVLQAIALFIVVIAWINFINLSTAKSVDRIREVGVRKVMGARKNELIQQFFTEAVLINCMAVLLALAFVNLGQPLFNLFVEKSLSLQSIDLDRFGLLGVIIFLLGTALSGFYPALVLSSHQTINALKGKSKIDSGLFLRRGLIVFQLLFSFLLIIATLTINEQLKYMNSQDMGIDMEQVLILRGPVVSETRGQENIPNIEAFKEQVLAIPGVSQIGTSTVIPGHGILRGNVISHVRESDSDMKSIERVVTSNDFLSTIKANFLIGKDFDKTMEGYIPIIINASAARELDFADPADAIGQILYESNRYERRVVGVIEDYHHESLNRAIDPMYFVRNEGLDTYYAIRLNSSKVSTTLDRIEEQYITSYPGNPAEYYFLDEFFARQYKQDEVNSKVFSAFALMAIIVACLGLYGLSAYAATQRTKEVGVRKVLGANVPNLFLLLFKEVFLLVAIGFLIALPMAYFGIDSWLSNFAYRMEIGGLLFVLPLLGVLTITLLATAQQIIKVSVMNPVKSLRYE
ncbi:MAG: FtsX-like permease family protein [Roseivirga sp.]|nr:FtsX-like permease family protein [Roseivirga sp.]